MTEPTHEAYWPVWERQEQFITATEPIRGFVGGQGSGKSTAGAIDLLCRAKASRLYLVTAPTYKVLRDSTCRSFEAAAQVSSQLLRPVAGEAFSARIRTTDRKGGVAEVLFRSTENPDLLRGPSVTGAWMDEASLSDHEAFQIVNARLRERGEHGWLSLTFTPKGRSHWTYHLFHSGRPDVSLAQAHTAENPFLPTSLVESLSLTYGGLLARQELGGEFVSVEGAEFPPEYFPESIYFDDWPAGPWLVHVLALDPSKGKDIGKGDYAAFAFLCVDGDGHLWCDCHAFRGKTAEYLAAQAVEHCRAFRPDRFAVESNQWLQLFAALINAEAQRRQVLCPVVELYNDKHKAVRIARLGEYLRSGRLHVRSTPGGKLLVEQLQEFPVGSHDDCPDALEMAVRVAADLLNERADGPPTPTVLYS